MNNFPWFTGKVALVTGAGSGIGKAIAARSAKESAHIAIADIDVDATDKVKDEIQKMGRSCTVHKTDVSDSKRVDAI